jgi:predicted transcriptional regulator
MKLEVCFITPPMFIVASGMRRSNFDCFVWRACKRGQTIPVDRKAKNTLHNYEKISIKAEKSKEVSPMEDHLKAALEIVKAQASVRTMTSEEIIAMVQGLAKNIQGITGGDLPETPDAPVIESKKSIKEKSITCLECGKVFKLLTKKHLATHGLDADAYREKWGLKPKTSLVAKGLQRERRKKMTDMRLWERRGVAKAATETTAAKEATAAAPKKAPQAVKIRAAKSKVAKPKAAK